MPYNNGSGRLLQTPMFYLFSLFYSFLPLHNPIGFGAADFIELALAILLVAAALAWSLPVVSGVGHDAVVGAAGAGAAGAGAVAAEHLRGGPAVEFHQVSFGAAAV